MNRLKEHNKNEDKKWWIDTFIFLSEDFNKNTLLFFENLFINEDEWIETEKWTKENKNKGQDTNSEIQNVYDKNVNKNFEYVIEKFMLLFKNEFYIENENNILSISKKEEFFFKSNGGKYKGTLSFNDKENVFILHKGAVLNPNPSTNSLSESYIKNINDIFKISEKNNDGSYITKEDLKRKTPSFFSDLICGYSRNGWTSFKNKEDKNLLDYKQK